jgi:hypothetical protein
MTKNIGSIQSFEELEAMYQEVMLATHMIQSY